MSCAAKMPYIKNTAAQSEQINPLDESNIDYEVYLVGDIGANDNLVLSDIVDLIKTQLRESDIKQSVIFLGNSISENGFPEEEDPEYEKMDQQIDHCVEVLKDYTDKLFFIPGNSEWYDGQDYTSTALSNVEDYIESKVDGRNIFVPSHGCGEPKLVDLTDDLALMLIDSQWILEGDRSDERSRAQCEIDYEENLIAYMKEKLSKCKNKNVIVAAHHPVFSNGKTGGNYGWSSNLLPAPIIGSILTVIKKVNGGQQKFSHPQYQTYRNVIDEVLDDHEGIIFASAHDKNMQYELQDKNHYVIAGSGAAVDYVREGGNVDFAYMSQGFAKITHTKDLELWLEFFVPDPQGKQNAQSVFKQRIYKKEFVNYADSTVYIPIEKHDKLHITKASTIYDKGVIGMGSTYRKEWGTELKVPVFLLEEQFGGLEVTEQGGGFQTKSLRLEDKEGRQWVLRTIDKDITTLVPGIFRRTFVQTVVQDGISASHPYAGFVLPKLEAAAGIYHTNPKLVWLPRQKALGDYNVNFGDKLYMFEERAGGNLEGRTSFGNAKEAFSTQNLLDTLVKNHKVVIDEEYVLKCRLFDILIGDWDRGDDQWRWGLYEDDDTNVDVFRPIPRDRDQAFFKNEGFINYVASRPYFNPALRKFDDEIDELSGLIYTARYFDRTFISQLNKEDYIKAAKDLQGNLTDEIIEQAFSDWPKEIYDISGQKIINTLKQRREDLIFYASQFYELITKEITVVGTYKKNIFNINTLPDDKLDVKVYHIGEGRENLIWSRIISGEDCEELRIYGLNDKDIFNFDGTAESSIKIHLVGGSGDDQINNNATDLEILVYDRKDGMEISGNRIKSNLKNRRGVNRFNRMDWELDRSIQFPMINFYTDEGLGLSYNLWWRKHGFRKSPYKSNHVLSLSYFSANSAFIGRYSGHWVSPFGGDWDLKFKTELSGPVFTQFYYGLGNEYIDYESIFPNAPDIGNSRFFIVKGSHAYVNPYLICNLGNNRSLSLDPSFEFLKIDNEPSDPNDIRFIFLPEAELTSFDFENKYYVGLGMNYTSDRVNHVAIPTQGYKFYAGANYRHSLTDAQYRNVKLESNLSLYVPLTPTHSLVIASYLGGAYTYGDYEFFHANYLATRQRLRGFRRSRFSGDGIVYAATDLRYKILQGTGGIRTGLGIYGSYDIGRAFLKGDEINDSWHSSFGGGIFLTPLNLLGFTFGYYVGDQDTQIVAGGSLTF